MARTIAGTASGAARSPAADAVPSFDDGVTSVEPADVRRARRPPWPACSTPERRRRSRRTCARSSADAARPAAAGRRAPKAIIVPHAGYVYSGAIAASAYARLAAGRDDDSPRRAARPGAPRAGSRPRAAVGARLCHAARRASSSIARPPPPRSRCRRSARATPRTPLEHSLEVQLPFLQAVLGRFRIVPFAVGDATPREVAEVIELLWGGPETLIVVSSDLSHYHRYADALRDRPRDRRRHRRAVGRTRSRAGVRRDADQRACFSSRAATGLRSRAARPAQLGRHGRRQIPRRRLCVVRIRGPPTRRH